ncbi:hypothetical protein Tco_0307158 [Tanacetum coccineum]
MCAWSGDTEELDLETLQSTARQSTITPRTLNFEDEAGPSSPIRPTQNLEPEEQFKVAEVLADISRPRTADPKDKGKGILVEEPKKKKLTLQQIRALETTNDEEVAKKIQAEWDAEEERKVQEIPLKTPLKFLFQWDSEKRKGDVERKEIKRLILKKGQDKESLDGISMITDAPKVIYTTIWETPDNKVMMTSGRNQEDWEIIKLMIRMLDHGMEVEDESEIAITLIHLFILWTTEDGDNP